MAIHHPTPPLGGVERPRLPSAQVGPVTQAIRAMRAPDPAFGHSETEIEPKFLFGHAETASRFRLGADLRSVRALSRTEVEDLIGGLIGLLDAMDGDTDREPQALDASAADWPGRGAHRFNVGEAA